VHFLVTVNFRYLPSALAYFPCLLRPTGNLKKVSNSVKPTCQFIKQAEFQTLICSNIRCRSIENSSRWHRHWLWMWERWIWHLITHSFCDKTDVKKAILRNIKDSKAWLEEVMSPNRCFIPWYLIYMGIHASINYAQLVTRNHFRLDTTKYIPPFKFIHWASKATTNEYYLLGINFSALFERIIKYRFAKDVT
jgi:hypothetical protein